MPEYSILSSPARARPDLCPACGSLPCLCRPRFFAGQLLTDADLQALDHYIIEKNKLHNRYLHGWGTVCGLEVLCHECKGWVMIKAGYALDPCGNDIVVCEDYSFDLCARIQPCCDRQRKDWECEPMAAAPADCDELEQCWLVTLRYAERESRGVTALKTPSTSPCCGSCGCGSSSTKARCGCSCHGNGQNGHQPAAAPCSNSVRRPPLQCEPTRICEGFVVEVAPAPLEDREPSPLKAFDGTLLGALSECVSEVEAVKAKRPAATTQQACCLYKKVVWDFLKGHELTRCELLAKVSAQSCAADPQAAMDSLDQLLDQFLRDCSCLALLPPCPADPGDPRVILACVTVKRENGECRIMDICHWHGRRFVWTWPNAFYWASLGTLFKQVLENRCCKEEPVEAPPQLEADLAVTDVGGTINDNQTVTWRVAIQNKGPKPAQDVVLRASVSADLTGITFTPTATVISSAENATLKTMNPGDSRMLEVVIAHDFTAAGVFEVTLRAEVSSSTHDPVQANNVREATVELSIVF